MNLGRFLKSIIASQPTVTKNLFVGDDEKTFVYGEESSRIYSGREGFDIVKMGGGSDGPAIPSDQSFYPTSMGLDQLGIHIEDLRKDKDGNYVAAAAGGTKKRGGSGYKPGQPEPDPSPDPMVTIFNVINTSNNTIPSPRLLLPQQRVSAATQAQNYFLTDGVAGPAIRTLYEFVIGAGFRIEVDYTFPTVPTWFNINDPLIDVAKSKYPGRNTKARATQIFLAYLTLRAQEIKDKLDLDSYATELARDALVCGDAFGYRIDSIVDDTYVDDLLPKAEYPFNDIYTIQGINPLSIIILTDDFNVPQSATIRAASIGGSNVGIDLPDITKLIHLKWHGSTYSTYGNSHLQNALDELLLKQSLIGAMKASADRFAVPIRLAQFGVMAPGADGGPIANLAMKEDMKNALATFNPATDTIVGPFHWKIQLIGAEGKILSLADEIEACNRRIMMAIGIPPNFLDSNYTSFATAKIQFSTMILKLRQLQVQLAKCIEDQILQPWAEMRGYRDPNGGVIKFKVDWVKGNLEADPEILSTLRTLAATPGQQIMSRKTMRELIGVSNDVEDANLAAEWDQDAAVLQERMQDPDFMLLQPNTQVPLNPFSTQTTTPAPATTPAKESGDNPDQNDASQTKKPDPTAATPPASPAQPAPADTPPATAANLLIRMDQLEHVAEEDRMTMAQLQERSQKLWEITNAILKREKEAD